MYPLASSAVSSGVPLNQSPDAKFLLPGVINWADMYPSGVHIMMPWAFSPIGTRFGEPSTGDSIEETSLHAPISCSLDPIFSHDFFSLLSPALLWVIGPTNLTAHTGVDSGNQTRTAINHF